MPADYTFVTVTHTGDHGLLLLQARSLARYLDPALATEIVVVDNPVRAAEERRRELLAAYGPLAPRVRFLEAADIVAEPLQLAGWWSQQVLKLLVAELVETERYVVLDAKNHLVFPLARDFLEAPSGRMRSRLEDYSAHPLLPWLRRTTAYFGLRLLPPPRFLPTTTPFTLDTALAREVVRYLEEREGAPFPEAFMRHGGIFTEFFLVVAYVQAIRRDLDSLWELSSDWSPALWSQATEEDVLRTVRRVHERETPVFALHRRLLPILGEPARAAVADLWWRRGLYPSSAAALDALAGELRSDAQWAADVELPGVSVIVPTRNRPGPLGHTVETLQLQDYPAGLFEIVVVDDGSSTPVEVPDGVRLVRHDRPRGPNAARNSGIEAARFDLLCFVDDDVEAPWEWLRELALGALRHPDAACLGGAIRLRLEDVPYRTCAACAGRHGETELYLGGGEGETDHDVYSANFAIPRRALVQHGVFSESQPIYYDEIEWLDRVRRAGERVVYLPDAWLWHLRSRDDMRVRRTLGRRYRRGRGTAAYRLAQGLPPGGSLRAVRPPLAHALRSRCAVGLFDAAIELGTFAGGIGRGRGGSAVEPSAAERPARRPRRRSHPAAARSQWSAAYVAGIDFERFRADSPYVWQPGHADEVYARSYAALGRRAPHLLERCDEDGAFGATVVEVDGRLVSRDLLDSVAELAFLEEELGSLESLTAIDVGAGYGRLAHRAAEALPGLSVVCADAIPESTALSRFYLGHRGVDATVAGLGELDGLVRRRLDVALAVHTLPEWPYAASRWWLEWLASREVPLLFVVPNTAGELRSVERDGSRRDLQPLLRSLGYRLQARRTKYPGTAGAEWLLQDEHLLYARR